MIGKTAREMIEQEFSGKLGPQSIFGPDGNIRSGVVFAAERVIERLRAALDEQTSRGNHHKERASEYASEVLRLTLEVERLRDALRHIVQWSDAVWVAHPAWADVMAGRAALGEAKP